MWFVFSLQLAKFQTCVGTNVMARSERKQKYGVGKKKNPDPAAQIHSPSLQGPQKTRAGPQGKPIPPQFTFTSLSQPQETMMGLLLFGEKRTHDTHSEWLSSWGRATMPGSRRGNGAGSPHPGPRGAVRSDLPRPVALRPSPSPPEPPSELQDLSSAPPKGSSADIGVTSNR